MKFRRLTIPSAKPTSVESLARISPALTLVRGPSDPLQQVGDSSVVPGSLQILRYALAAAEFAGPLTTYASSSVTRYRNGQSPAPSPDAFFPLTRPQMVSTDFPNVFLRMARFISPNSADAGSSNFEAIVAFAVTMTGSDVSAGRPDAGAWTFASITAGFAFFAARWGSVTDGGSRPLFRPRRAGGLDFRCRGTGPWTASAPVQPADWRRRDSRLRPCTNPCSRAAIKGCCSQPGGRPEDQ